MVARSLNVSYESTGDHVAISRVLLVSGSAHFSTRDVWDGYRISLEAAGIGVIPYPTFSLLKLMSAETVCANLLGTALDIDNRIDCVIFVDGLWFRGKRARIPQSIRRAGLPTVLIATDDPYDEIPHLESLYTYRFTNEIRSAHDGTTYLPTATLPLPQYPRVEKPAYDISFLGTVFEDRYPLLMKVAEHCETTNRRFLIAGKILKGQEEFQRLVQTDVRQRTIDPREKFNIYANSRVTINAFRETDKPADSPSPRVFEVTAFGQAALLTGPKRQEVTEIFGDSVFHYENEDDVLTVIDAALSDEPARMQRIEQAQAITYENHLYEHRVETLVDTLREAEQARTLSGLSEEKIGWLIGCGRTGSTWLSEMLGDLKGIRRWHEPYFGRFLKHLHERPEETQRHSSFFAERHQKIWQQGLRELFFKMVQDRYPQFGKHALVVKEVNTPELYAWLAHLFPASRMILLVRDPFDVLDSYLDLQKPGSWNPKFGDKDDPLGEKNVRRTCELIRSTNELALTAFENFPVGQKLEIRYEDLLDDTPNQLMDCGDLLGISILREHAEEAAEKRAFENYAKTGTLEFRRKGQAGVWQLSPNFTREVKRIAEEMLGPIRARLGYAVSRVE